MVNHKSNFEITKLSLYLEERFFGLTANHDDKHTYLGIGLDFSNDGEVEVSQVLLHAFPKKMGPAQPTPAMDHLFKVRPEEDAHPLPD